MRSEAVAIDPAAHTVTVRELNTGREYAESYDKLILSPGARAVRPPLPGADSGNIHTLRTVEDTLRIREIVETRHPKSAVVVGGGFIGLEMAENLMHAGLHVTLIQHSDHVLPPMDPDLAGEIHSYLRSQGLDLRLNTAVTGVWRISAARSRVLIGDASVETDLAVLAVGVAPDSGLAKKAGLALGVRGSIAVDEHMRTSDPDIYAVGDAVEVTSLATGQKALVALAGPANRQGRIAADHICGLGSAYSGAQGTSVIMLFEMTAASTGLNEENRPARKAAAMTRR